MTETLQRIDDVLPSGSRSLSEISQDIAQAQMRLAEKASEVIQEAIRIGEALLEAKALLPDGEFTNWCENNVAMSQGSRANYMRIAEFKDKLPGEILNPRALDNGYGGAVTAASRQPASLKPALQYIRTLGLTRHTGRWKPDQDEIRRLNEEGVSRKDIAAMLGCHIDTVKVALLSKEQYAARRRRRENVRRARERLIRDAKRREAMKNASPDLAEAYSLLRKCLQHAQSAHDAYHPGNARKTLVSALSYLHKAEDALARAETLAKLEVQ